MKIAIVDYGTGNLRSVGQAVKAVADGADVLVTQSSAEIDAADRVIFPGQGAMGDCMRCLGESGLKDAVLRALASKPVLAVCIGMQMLFERSDENDCAGLGLMAGKVIRFPEAALVRANGERLKVPQMGGTPSRSAWHIPCGTALLTRAGFISCTAISWRLKTMRLRPALRATVCPLSAPSPETISLQPSFTRKRAPQAV